MGRYAAKRYGERGVSGLEYAGAIMIAALIVGSITLAVVSADVRGRVVCAVQSIFQQGSSCGEIDAGEDTAEEDDKIPEKCKVHEVGEQVSTKIKVVFFEIGSDAALIVSEYSDDTVTITATSGDFIGATGGLGADAAWGEGELAAKVDFGGGVEFNQGSTWTFDDIDQADVFREQLDEYLAQMAAIDPINCIGLSCLPTADPPPVPSTTVNGVKVSGEVSGSLGLTFNDGGAPATQAELNGLGVAGSLDPSANWTLTNDNGNTPDDASDDTTTYTTDMQLNSEISHQVGLATGGTGSVLGMTLSVKEDADGNIVEVSIVSTSEINNSSGQEGSGGVTKGKGDDKKGGDVSVGGDTTDANVVVTETVLPVDPDDAQGQQVVKDWLGGGGGYSWPGLISLNMINPQQPDPNDPFAMMLYNDAISSTMAYNNVTDVDRFALNVKLGAALGVDFSTEKSESTVTDATYLGPPGPDGQRPVVDYTDCVA